MLHSHLAAWATDMMREPQESSRPLGLVWVDCPRSVLSAWLVRTLENRATVHQAMMPPRDGLSCIILCANSPEGLSERVEFYQDLRSDAPPIVVFSPQLDLPFARDALLAGASGFVHAEMMPGQLVRALAAATGGSSSRHGCCFGTCRPLTNPVTSPPSRSARGRSWVTWSKDSQTPR